MLRLQCPCGCELFALFRNAYTPDEQAVLDAYNKECGRLLGHGAVYGASDADGTVHTYRRRFGLFRQEIILPECPSFSDITVIKAICANCGTEHLLFDNRLHGYDALTEAETDSASYEVTLYRPLVQKPHIVWIRLEWDDDPERFGWIGIAVSASAKGRRRWVFEAETA